MAKKYLVTKDTGSIFLESKGGSIVKHSKGSLVSLNAKQAKPLVDAGHVRLYDSGVDESPATTPSAPDESAPDAADSDDD